MTDPFFELTVKLSATASIALQEVLRRHPEKRLPHWRPSWWKYWFHLHRWKRGLFDGTSFPKSIGYEVEMRSGDTQVLRLLWECERCPAVMITTDVVTNNDDGIE